MNKNPNFKLKFYSELNCNITKGIKLYLNQNIFKQMHDVVVSGIDYSTLNIETMECEANCLYDGILTMKFKADPVIFSLYGIFQRIYVEVNKPFEYKHITIRQILINTSNNTCLIMFTLISESYKDIKYASSMFNKSIFDSIINVINENINNLEVYQIESCIINNSLQSVWKIISNWKNFQIYDFSIPRFHKGSVDFNKVNNIFFIKCIESGKEIIHGMKIIYCDKKKTEATYQLGCFELNNYNFIFIIAFKLIKCKENQTYLEFKHILNREIEIKHRNDFSNTKIRIIKNLQRKLKI